MEMYKDGIEYFTCLFISVLRATVVANGIASIRVLAPYYKYRKPTEFLLLIFRSSCQISYDRVACLFHG